MYCGRSMISNIEDLFFELYTIIPTLKHLLLVRNGLPIFSHVITIVKYVFRSLFPSIDSSHTILRVYKGGTKDLSVYMRSLGYNDKIYGPSMRLGSL